MSTTVRITCTVPADVLRSADRLAARLDRSRSWVVTEGIRRLGSEPGAAPSPDASVGAASSSGHTRAFRVAERERLERDLARTPADRVRISEEIARSTPPREPRRDRVLQFATYEAYLDWRRFAGLEP